MKGNSVHKVKSGKILKVSLEFEQGKILGVRISGDFFMHPEEAITLLEEGLKGSKLEEENLSEKIEALVKGNSVKLYGFEASDLAKAIMEAL